MMTAAQEPTRMMLSVENHNIAKDNKVASANTAN
jgi:hypothetical protein